LDLTDKELIELESEDSSDSMRKYNGVTIPKYLRHPNEYVFLEVPVIVPSKEEMDNPFLLVRRLHAEGYSRHGVVKIRPDKSMWNP